MSQAGDFKVPPLRWVDIGNKAFALRQQFGLHTRAFVPVVDLIERILDNELGLVKFQVGSHQEMGMAEGYTCPDGKFIMLREDVYVGTCSGEGRARFTTAHELGHWALHAHVPVTLARSQEALKPYQLAEPQANQFAARFLMPDSFIDTSDTEDELMERFGVLREAARLRLSTAARERSRN